MIKFHLFHFIFAFRNATKNKTMAKQSETIVKAVPATVVGALADAFERSISTIVRWISKNDDRLTSDKARKVFSDYDFVWEAEEAAAK